MFQLLFLLTTAYSTVGELYARNKLAAAFPLTMRLNGPFSIRKLQGIVILHRNLNSIDVQGNRILDTTL